MAGKASFGGSIKLSGESEYRRALSNINTDLKVLGSGLKAAAAQFDDNDKSVENLSKQNDILNKSIEEQKKKVETLRKALADAKSETGDNSATTKKWQYELNNAEADLGKLNRQLRDNEKDLKDAESAADGDKKALKDLGDQSDKTGSKMEALSKGLKVAAAAVAAVGAAAVAAGKKLWNMANDVADAGDEIDKMSQKIGISTKSYQEWKYVFERSGTDVNNLQTGMKKLSDVIVDAGKGSDSANKKLAAVGLTLKDLNGKSQDEQLSIVIAALQNMESGAERTAAATDLLGKSATDMAAVLNMTAEETDALKQEAEDYGMVMSDDAVKASVAFKDSLLKLKGTITGVKNAMIGQMLPGITKITNGLADLVKGSDGARDSIKEGISEILTNIQESLPTVLSAVGSIVDALLEEAPVILEGLINGIVTLLPSTLETLLTKVLPNLVTVALNALKSTLQALTEMMPELMKTLAQTVVDIAKELFSPENILETVDLVIGFIGSVIEGAQAALPILIQGAIDLAIGLVQNADKIVTKLIEMIPDLIDGFLDPDTGLLSIQNINRLFSGVMQLTYEIALKTPQIVGIILHKIPEIIDDICDAFGKLIGRLTGIGEEAGSGLVGGLGKTALTTVEGFVNPLKSPVARVISGITGNGWNGFSLFADGGVVNKPTAGIFGEKGAEAIVPLERNTQWIDRVAEQMYAMYNRAAAFNASPAPAVLPAAASPQYNIHVAFGDVTLGSDMDIDTVAQQMSQAIAREVLAKGGSWA